MKLHDRISLAAAAVLVLATAPSCLIDFTEDIPCDSSEQCPSGFGCNGTVCVEGASGTEQDAGDSGADTTADVAADLPVDTSPDVPQPDVAQDVTEDIPNTDADAADVVEDTTPDVPDGPCYANMAHVTDVAEPFCIDQYEASRPDATSSSAGTTNNQGARSVPGVLPWTQISTADARAACAAAGKRLCTQEEWETGCGGSSGQLYPYDAATYDREACNTTGSIATTNAFAGCIYAPYGTVDMSGNVAEYIDVGATAIAVKGGSYTDFSEVAFQCGGPPRNLSPRVSVGFRCCADPLQ